MGLIAPFNNLVTINQGQTAQLTIQLIDGNTLQPFNLGGLTGATGIFPNLDGVSGLAASGILASQDLGTLTFNLDEAFTAQLNIGEQQPVQVMVDQGAVRSVAVLQQVLTVIAPPFAPVNFGP
jgi:hypothetical protein